MIYLTELTTKQNVVLNSHAEQLAIMDTRICNFGCQGNTTGRQHPCDNIDSGESANVPPNCVNNEKIVKPDEVTRNTRTVNNEGTRVSKVEQIREKAPVINSLKKKKRRMITTPPMTI